MEPWVEMLDCEANPIPTAEASEISGGCGAGRTHSRSVATIQERTPSWLGGMQTRSQNVAARQKPQGNSRPPVRTRGQEAIASHTYRAGQPGEGGESRAVRALRR